MSSFAVEASARATHVAVTQDELVLHLVDGRTLSVPLVWFPSLLEASPEQRNAFRLIGDGEYINWPELDEDLSVAGLLRGISAAQKRSG
jgi:Protein of unknown function (DUF2442)